MNLNSFRSLITLLCFAFAYYGNPLIAEEIKTTNNSEYIIKEDIFNKSNKKVKVKSKGIGKSLKEAKEDAAINAISKVVGTFFDSNSKIKLKKTSHGKRTNKLKEISKEYFTYNRGNIYNFEIIKIENKDNIYYVEALVDVINENIQDYIEEFTAGESIVDLEVLTIKGSRDKNKKQINTLLANLLERKNDLDYQYISHGKGQLLENFSFLSYCENSLNHNKGFCEIYTENFNLDKDCFLECVYSDRRSVANEIEKYRVIKNLRNPHNIFVLPFKVSIRDDYKKIYKNLFYEISKDTKIIKYSDKNLFEVSKNTIDFLENNFKDKDDRLIIFNEINESELTNFYIEKNVKNSDLYIKLFSDIDYEDPRLVLLIKDKFNNIKKTIIFNSSIAVNTSIGLCGVNSLLDEFLIPKCVSNYINEAKIISLLNDLPISKSDELSLVNSVRNDYFKYSPIVVNTEKNFLLLLNLSKFELDKDDSIVLEFQSLKDKYDNKKLVFKENELEKKDKKKQRELELAEQRKKELELAERRRKELGNLIVKTENYNDDSSYTGQFLNGKRHGQGTYFYPNGNKYIGQWKDDKLNGKGTLTWSSGDKYVGQYLNNKRHGQGTYFYPNGSKYIGQWKDDERTGQGIFTWHNGDRYVGQFLNGKRHGQGTYFYVTGDRYLGQWKNSKKFGPGTYFYADGRTQRENW